MKRYKGMIAAALSLSMLTGCVIKIDGNSWDGEDNWRQRQDRNADYIPNMVIGQSLSLIEADLGRPDFNESFQRNGETIQVIYYRTQQLDEDGRTTKNETTPLVFIDNELVGWGEIALEKASR